MVAISALSSSTATRMATPSPKRFRVCRFIRGSKGCLSGVPLPLPGRAGGDATGVDGGPRWRWAVRPCATDAGRAADNRAEYTSFARLRSIIAGTPPGCQFWQFPATVGFSGRATEAHRRYPLATSRFRRRSQRASRRPSADWLGVGCPPRLEWRNSSHTPRRVLGRRNRRWSRGCRPARDRDR